MIKCMIKCIWVKDLMEDKLCQLTDQFNKIKINHRDFYYTLLNSINVEELVRYYLLAISIKRSRKN